ncbi:MAG: peptidase M23, partial [Candidatus Magasanikbacteria bacterium CG_4_10_14_0_2_um_filter_37_12]
TGRTKIVQHIVQSGDTLGGIAEEYGVSVSTVLWANDLSVRSILKIGQSLDILPVEGLVHVVKKGDTVSKLASLYDAEADQIIEYNRLQANGADIVIGENLVIPGGVKSEPKSTYIPPQSYDVLRGVSAPPPSVESPAGSGYIWPANVRTITQYFGWRHTGLDIAGPVGSSIYAAKSGKVITSQDGWNGGYGNYVIIDHGGGVQTLYGHSSRRLVSVGEQVKQGQTIALIGSTGNSTGPHLHFEVRVNGRRSNPLQYIR